MKTLKKSRFGQGHESPREKVSPLLLQTVSGLSIVWLTVTASKQPSERASAVVGPVAFQLNKIKIAIPFAVRAPTFELPSKLQPFSDGTAHTLPWGPPVGRFQNPGAPYMAS